MKKCTKCNIQKELTNFRPRNQNCFYSWCISCEREYQREYYRNSEEKKIQLQRSLEKRKKQKQILWWNWLLDHPCPCGEANPLLLELDHETPLLDAKVKRIASLINTGVSWSTVLDTIKSQKCQVLCVKCHRLKTAKELENWKWKIYCEYGQEKISV